MTITPSGPNVCAALFNAKYNLPRGAKAYYSIEAAISVIESTIGKGMVCEGPDV